MGVVHAQACSGEIFEAQKKKKTAWGHSSPSPTLFPHFSQQSDKEGAERLSLSSFSAAAERGLLAKAPFQQHNSANNSTSLSLLPHRKWHKMCSPKNVGPVG